MASQLAIHRSIPPLDDSSAHCGGNIRVVIRMENVRQNLRRQLGSRPTDSDVYSWLRTLGFVPATDGNAWTCDQDTLRWLADGEIARTERVEFGPDDEGHAAGRTREMLHLGWRDFTHRFHSAVDFFARTISHS